MLSKAIMEQVGKVEEEKAQFDRCLEARLCPLCGKILNLEITDDENLPDEVFECSSTVCDFTYTRAWV